MKLRDICHARSGDKGDTSNIGLIVYDKADYEWLVGAITVEKVASYLGPRVKGPIERYELPLLGAVNFVIHGALDGGGTRSRRLDAYGKARSTVLLEMGVDKEPRAAATGEPMASLPAVEDGKPGRDDAGRVLRLGCGSGFGTDYLEGAVDLVTRGNVDYLIFDWISERTLIEATRWKLEGGVGYDPEMEDRLRVLLPLCAAAGVKIITNWGAADVETAAFRTQAIAQEIGVGDIRIAYILGSDVLSVVEQTDPVCAESERPISELGSPVVAAHAYQGAVPIVKALAGGADIVISGRAGDSAQYLAPMMHEFGWSPEDWRLIGKGLAIGHIVECGPHATGGYFADPGVKDVPYLYRVGLPIAEVRPNGDAIITKLPGTGGVCSIRTCTEQIVYEIGDPSRYIHTDGVVDFSSTTLREDEPDRVLVTGTEGSERPPMVKVNLGIREGFSGVCQTVYSGTGAYSKARLAASIVVARLATAKGLPEDEVRTLLDIGYIGVNSVFDWTDAERDADELREVGLRICGRFSTRAEAQQLVNYMFALSSAGPSGVTHGREVAMGGVEEIFGLYTTYLPQASVVFDTHFLAGVA
jgi:hypothetical protein